MTYYKYAERQVDSRINWAEVGKDMSDMLLEERKLRERKRQEIDAASTAFGETLSDAPTGDYDAGNTFTLEYAEAAQQNRRMQDHLLKTGQLSLRDYTVGRQNIQSGTSLLFDLQKEYQKEYSDKMTRWEGDESAFREVWEMEQAEGLANLRDSRAYINPTNGVVSVGKLIAGTGTSGVKTLDPNQNNYVTVNELNQRLKMKYNRFNVDAAADNAANQLGALELSTFQYASQGNINQIITMIDAKQHNFGLAGETWAAGYKDWEEGQVSAMMVNPNSVASVLTDRKRVIEVPDGQGGTKKERLTFTYDEKEYKDTSKNKGQMIYLDRTKDANGIPVFTPEQEEIVEQQLKLAIRANIDVKKQIKAAGTTQFKPKHNVNKGILETQQEDVIGKAAQLWWGNKEQKLKAAESLRGYNDNIKEMSLTADGKGIYITYNNKKAPETIEFGESQTDFLEGIGNFVLPTNNKIGNITEVAKKMQLDLSKDLLSGTDYAFTSKGEETVALPFEETYRAHEGGKIDKANVLQDVGPNITTTQRDSAINKITSFIQGVPGINQKKVEIKSHWTGYGAMVKINGKEYNIPFDGTKEAADDALQAVIDALISMGVSSYGILDPKAKDQYVKDYGQRRGSSQQQQGGGATTPAPRVP